MITFQSECEKRLEDLYFNTSDFYQNIYFRSATFRLPLYHPVRLVTLILFLSNIILVPIGYIKIFSFLKRQNRKLVGLSESVRLSRKQRNIVTIKCNLFNWILETTSILFVIVSPKNNFLYLFLMNCGPPILYFMGVGENRQATEEYFKSKIRVFHKTQANRMRDVSQDVVPNEEPVYFGE